MTAHKREMTRCFKRIVMSWIENGRLNVKLLLWTPIKWHTLCYIRDRLVTDLYCCVAIFPWRLDVLHIRCYEDQTMSVYKIRMLLWDGQHISSWTGVWTEIVRSVLRFGTLSTWKCWIQVESLYWKDKMMGERGIYI